ncbi:MAG: 50S ribosomal protein L9 [Nitrospirae bacterium]|nr:50S ribosomal protein L9 [Nitrospirota bacterium]
MKVILKDDIKSLGKMGATVNVSDGYARNFLIPKGLAVDASNKNILSLEHEKRLISAKAKKQRDLAHSLKERLSSMTLSIAARAGEEGKLFGSITTMDIADALKAEGIEMDKKKIQIEEPIKRLGDYTVSVRIQQDEVASVNIKVVSE